jgi:23S rRNA (pseudouridine1915-N3)-methyltransferase
MLKLRVLVVGRTEAGFVREGVEHYLARLRPMLPVEWEEVRAADHSGRSPEQALAREGEALLKKVGPQDWLVLLDEQGQSFTSVKLAQWLDKVRRRQATAAILAIGGAYGFPPAVLERANERISLSPLTFPHQLVRVILTEQLYRVAGILAGKPYHHA